MKNIKYSDMIKFSKKLICIILSGILIFNCSGEAIAQVVQSERRDLSNFQWGEGTNYFGQYMAEGGVKVPYLAETLGQRITGAKEDRGYNGFKEALTKDAKGERYSEEAIRAMYEEYEKELKGINADIEAGRKWYKGGKNYSAEDRAEEYYREVWEIAGGDEEKISEGFEYKGHRKEKEIKSRTVFEIGELPVESAIVVCVDNMYRGEVLQNLERAGYHTLFAVEI